MTLRTAMNGLLAASAALALAALVLVAGSAEAADNGGPVLLGVSIAAVPLPAAGLLLLGALGAVGLARRRTA